MNNKEIRIECMSDILSEIDVDLTHEQIKKIVDDFSDHIEMENELSSYQHVGFKETCRECESLKYKLKESEKENEVFRKSVKQRRHADHVWIEGDTVKYE